MYQQELHREARLVTQGWALIVRDLTRPLRALRAALSPTRPRSPTTFAVHRVPGSDYLR